jgi:uncharacterized membrane protein
MTNKISRATVIRILIVAAMFATALILYPMLPDMVPTHWGFDGAPNAWSPKWVGVLIGPVVGLVFLILFPILNRIDPKKENYEVFKGPWNMIQTALLVFMAYIFAVTMYVTFYPQYNTLVGRAVVFGIGILFVIIGNYMGKIRQNYFVGLRTPWTLNDPEVWQKSQRLAGWMFVLGGLAAMIEAVVWVSSGLAFFPLVLVVVIVPIIYSYLLSRKKMKA